MKQYFMERVCRCNQWIDFVEANDIEEAKELVLRYYHELPRADKKETTRLAVGCGELNSDHDEVDYDTVDEYVVIFDIQ